MAALSLLTACNDNEEENAPGYTLPQVDDVRVKNGYLRAEITVRVGDPATRRVALYWFPSNTDTVWLDVPEGARPQELTARIGTGTGQPIDEGDYRLKAVAFGPGAARSDIFFSQMTVYGETYAAKLANRPAEITTEGTSAMTVAFGAPVDEREIGVEIAYVQPDGNPRTLVLGNDCLAEPLRLEADLLQLATYRSLYLPQAGALDTLRAAPTKIAGYANVNVALNKKATGSDYFMAFTADKAVDGTKLVDTSRWVNNVAAGEHWLEIDLGAVYPINSYQVFMGTNSQYVGTKTPRYEFQAEVDGAWATLDSRPDALDPLHKCTFERSVATRKVRLYIPDGPWTDKIRLYEIEVYALI